jgi:hypothetical protein
MTNKTDIYNKIRNYNGNNDFLRKMKDSYQKWGRLTDKQFAITEKIILNEERQKEVDVTTLSPSLRAIVEYNGESTFVLDLKTKYLTYRTLTEKQIQKGYEAVDRENQKNSQVNMNIKLVGNTIKLGRKIAEGIKKEKSIDFHPILVDVTEVMVMSNKAFKLKAKLTKENGGICRCCGKTLTDEMSRMTGIGPVCSKYVGVEHPSNKADLPQYREEINKKIDEVGEFEFWIPKRGIVEWKGSAGVMLKF